MSEVAEFITDSEGIPLSQWTCPIHGEVDVTISFHGPMGADDRVYCAWCFEDLFRQHSVMPMSRV